WFLGCFALLLALLHPLVFGLAASRALVVEALTSRRAMVMAAALAFALGMVPFLRLYVPVLLAGHSPDFAEVAANMPEWRDLANVTPHNAVWGGLLEWLGIVGRPDRPTWEVELAFTPGVLAVFALGLVMLARRAASGAKHRERVFLLLGA